MGRKHEVEAHLETEIDRHDEVPHRRERGRLSQKGQIWHLEEFYLCFGKNQKFG